jgi:hypothetical protein
MAKPKLHLDEDASKVSLYRALLARGHDVTRTPNEWARLEDTDEEQLQKAGARGRTILTFNTRHFLSLAKRITNHAGIILSPQYPKSRVFKALDRFFNESSAEEMENQVRWLSDWEK